MAAAPRDRLQGRLCRILLALTLAYAALALGLRPGSLILLLNGLALSASTGVAVAYLPVARQALRCPVPSRGDVLGTGIFLAGVAGIARRVESIAARDLAQPHILNTRFAAVSIYFGLLALGCFLWAPYACDGQVPRERWTHAGLLVAAGVAIAFAAGVAHHFTVPQPWFRFE